MADAPARVPRNVVALGVVSLLGDVASEMIYPLLPVFLSSVLGASGTAIGAIEGFAESTSSLLKLASGWWADRARHRKPLVIVGYAISAVARPLVGVATATWHVLAVRMSDRTGKGIRTSPRDALLADSTDADVRGRAYGLHRALDNTGAVMGPLLGWMLYEALHVPMRSVFLWSVVPGVLSVAVLVWFVREPAHAPPATTSAPGVGATQAPLGAAFWRYLAVLFVFTLGASSDAFVLLRAQQLGVPVAAIPLLYAALNIVKAVSSTPGGALSDRRGRRPVIIAGWMLYAAVYLGFALASAAWHAVALFVAYGFFFGLTEGTEKAFVADLVPATRRGTAFGWYNFAIGIGALPASLVFGAVWDRFGSATAFGIGAALAAVAAGGLVALVPRR
ncbi:MAG TPA: MFS transporter [Gemmatimonadaceae bacterium]|nr:MFS transporter [Gemmatimonadaceae bacterium]